MKVFLCKNTGFSVFVFFENWVCVAAIKPCIFRAWLRLRTFLFTEEIFMGFSENLKAVRKANKMTQQQLADELGLGRPAIAKYETSDTLPKPRNIMKICEIFNLTFDELFSDENILEHLAARSEETTPTDCSANEAVE